MTNETGVPLISEDTENARDTLPMFEEDLPQILNDFRRGAVLWGVLMVSTALLMYLTFLLLTPLADLLRNR